MRRMMIACAVAALAAVSAPDVATARGGGGGHGGGGHGGGGMGHGGGMGRGGAFGFGGGRMGGIGFAAVHPAVAFGHGFHGRHVFVRNRFAFVGGGGYPYGDYGCYTRVWTTWGWTWRDVCY
jgi:hypothetical protein